MQPFTLASFPNHVGVLVKHFDLCCHCGKFLDYGRAFDWVTHTHTQRHASESQSSTTQHDAFNVHRPECATSPLNPSRQPCLEIMRAQVGESMRGRSASSHRKMVGFHLLPFCAVLSFFWFGVGSSSFACSISSVSQTH